MKALSPRSASAVSGEKWISVRAGVADVVGALRRGGGDVEGGGRNDIFDGAGDEPALHLMRLPAALDVRIGIEHLAHDRADQRHLDQVGELMRPARKASSMSWAL